MEKNTAEVSPGEACLPFNVPPAVVYSDLILRPSPSLPLALACWHVFVPAVCPLEARRTSDGFTDGEDKRQYQRQGLCPQQLLKASHFGQAHLLRTRLGVAIDLVVVCLV